MLAGRSIRCLLLWWVWWKMNPFLLLKQVILPWLVTDIWRMTKRMVMQAAVYQESELVLGLKWLVRQIRSNCFCKKSCRFATRPWWQSGWCVWLTSDETGMRRRDGLLNSHGKSRKCRTVEDLIDYPEKPHEIIPSLLWKLDWFLVCAVSCKRYLWTQHPQFYSYPFVLFPNQFPSLIVLLFSQCSSPSTAIMRPFSFCRWLFFFSPPLIILPFLTMKS